MGILDITLGHAIYLTILGGFLSWIPIAGYSILNDKIKEVPKAIFLFAFFLIGYLFVEVIGIT
jgi:hypothetical protein